MAVADAKNDRFYLPDMGDYYFECLDHKKFEAIAELAAYDVNRPSRLTPEQAAVYYLEDEPEVGYDPQYKTYTIRVDINNKTKWDDWLGGVQVVDGDTLVIHNSVIRTDNGGVNDQALVQFVQDITNQTKASLQKSDVKNVEATGGVIGLRFACIDTMEIPHFENCVPVKELKKIKSDSDENDKSNRIYEEITSVSYTEAAKAQYKFSKYYDYRDTKSGKKYNKSTADGDKMDFIKINGATGDRFYQYFDATPKGGNEKYRYILATDDSEGDEARAGDGGYARELVYSVLEKAEDMKILIDGTSINRVGSDASYTQPSRISDFSEKTPEALFRTTTSYLFKERIKYPQTGFNRVGTDVYSRALSVVYVKYNGKWINLNKFIAALTHYTQINKTMHSDPDQARRNFYSRVVDAESYEIDNMIYADTMWAQFGELDDRPKLQGMIFGPKFKGDMNEGSNSFTDIRQGQEYSKEEIAKMGDKETLDFSTLNEWTMTIGDCTFFIPPTSISCITQTRSMRLPLLRASGTMAKSDHRTLKTIQVSLYFNENRGVNGYTCEYPYPNKSLQPMNIHMNGLRALIAQFKLAPFLPIQNRYVNRVLDIDAVSMKTLTAENVEGFPHLIKVTLQMTQFEYRTYMPEVPYDEDDMAQLRNYFARQFNWPLFRYYYQRLLWNGDELIDEPSISDKYIQSTFGNKTCLVPMKFKSSEIKFYIPNEEHLKRLLQIKLSRMSRKQMPSDLTDNQTSDIEDYASIYDAVLSEYDPSKIMSDGVTASVPDADNPTSYQQLNNMLKDKKYNGMFIAATSNGDGPFVIKINEKGESVQDNDTKAATSAIQKQLDLTAKTIQNKVHTIERGTDDKLVKSTSINKQNTIGTSNTLRFEADNNSQTITDWSEIDSIRCNTFVRCQLNNHISNDEEYDMLRTYATQSQATGLANQEIYSFDEILKDNKLDIPITITLPRAHTIMPSFQQPGNDTYFIGALGDDNIREFNSGLGMDMDFLATMKEYDTFKDIGSSSFANALKQATDLETVNTIEWEQYITGATIIAEEFSIGMGNNFSQICLQELTGSAPQFMGGTDTHLSFSFTVTGEEAPLVAASMRALPEISAGYARDFRLVLTSWPLKIDSELTRLFGINNVTVETVNVDTIPGYPGTYKINVIAISVDRTLRNREAMSKRDLDNFKNLSVAGRNAVRYSEFDKINDILSEAELYPDLQLPTIKELRGKGWTFVRYSNSKRIYPDPDFYITYAYTLMSQLIRESVLSFQDHEISNADVVDVDGNRFVVDANKKVTQDYLYIPETPLGYPGIDAEKGEDGIVRQAEYASSVIYRNSHPENLAKDADYQAAKIDLNIINTIGGSFGLTWDICNDMKIALSEPVFYNAMLDEIKLRQKAIEKLSGYSTYQNAKDEEKEEFINKYIQNYKAKQKASNAQSTDEVPEEAMSNMLISVGNVDAKSITNSKTQVVAAENSRTGLNNTAGAKEKKDTSKSIDIEGKSEKVDEQSTEIENYVRTTWKSNQKAVMSLIDDILSKPISTTVESDTNTSATVNSASIYNASPIHMMTKGSTSEIIGMMEIMLPKFLKAAAAAKTGREEYDISGSKNSSSWEADFNNYQGYYFENDKSNKVFISYQRRKDYWTGQKKAEIRDSKLSQYATATKEDLENIEKEEKRQQNQIHVISNDKDIEKYAKEKAKKEVLDKLQMKGIEFGIYGFKLYTLEEIANMYPPGERDAIKDNAKVNIYGRYTLDPYYRSCDQEKLYGYVYNCLTNEDFANVAFWRICLFWLKVLIRECYMPSYCYDHYRSSLTKSDYIQKILDATVDITVDSQTEGLKEELKRLEDASNKRIENIQNNKDLPDAARTTQVESEKEAFKKLKEQKEAEIKAEEDRVIAEKDKLKKENNKTGEELTSLFRENCIAVDKGKLFLMFLMALTDGDRALQKCLADHDINTLNSQTKAILSGGNTKLYRSQYMATMRKFVKALVGTEVIDKDQLTAKPDMDLVETINRTANRANYVAASNNPKLWLCHSYYDMVVNDARGRLARAFPSFYMIFIDEGRRIAKWKLHDNFYNTSSISEITITKSKNIAADTAEITMSNFFQTFTTEDEDMNYNYTYSVSDIISRLFSPQQYAQKAEFQRDNSMPVERMKIEAGTRIHIRMGYGADANKLPIMFNGIIAEIESDDIVKIVAQGDGIELSNPILLDIKAHQITHKDEWTGFNFINNDNGASPKTILDGLLTTHGSALNTLANEWRYEESNDIKSGIAEIINSVGTPINPFGLYHFGDVDFKYLPDMPEPTQNIFEVQPPMDDDANKSYSQVLGEFGSAVGAITGGVAATALLCPTGPGAVVAGAAGAEMGGWLGAHIGKLAGESADTGLLSAIPLPGNNPISDGLKYPEMEIDLFGKSIWDIMHIVKSIEPEYITSVVPFGFRSTIFFGRPHDYYAYQYIKDSDGKWVDKRKPFQQYHIITSSTDIIANQMQASQKNIATCCVGLYEVEGSFNCKIQEKTDPIWVDKQIYPEHQKTIYYDTKLYGAPSRKLGILSDITNWFTAGIFNDTFDRFVDKHGDVRNHHAMATTMATDALKTNMGNMYQGPITIIGDPTIKPYDRVCIDDYYQAIHGDVLVRDVVHCMSATDGYITTFYPELIATTRDGADVEAKRQVYTSSIQSAAASILFVNAVKRINPLTRMLGAMIDDIEKGATKVAGVGASAGKWASNIVKDGFNKAYSSVNMPARLKTFLTTGMIGKVGKAGSLVGKAGLAGATGLGHLASGSANAIKRAAGTSLGQKLLGKKWEAIGYVATFAFGGALSDFISSTWDNRRALTLFPVKHYNKVMTAGVNGSTTLCYGAPGYEGASDYFETMINWIHKEHPMLEELSYLLYTDQADNPFVKTANDRATRLGKIKTENQIVNGVNEAVHLSQEGLYSRHKIDYKIKRVGDLKNKKNHHTIVKAHGIFAPDGSEITAELISSHRNWPNMIAIKDYAPLKSYLDNKFFRIAWYEPAFNPNMTDKIVELQLTTPNDSTKTIAVYAYRLEEVVGKSKEINIAYDIPYLQSEALAIMTELVKRAYNLMEGTEQTRDDVKRSQDNSTNCIYVKSALRAGSIKNYNGTGYAFELEAIGLSSNGVSSDTQAYDSSTENNAPNGASNPEPQKTTVTTEGNKTILALKQAEAGWRQMLIDNKKKYNPTIQTDIIESKFVDNKLFVVVRPPISNM